MPISRKKTFNEHNNKLSPKVNRANMSTHGIIRNNLKLMTKPNQCITATNTIRVSNKLKSSLNISDSGKKTTGIFSDLIIPAEPMIFATDCPVTLAKKNQIISPDKENST
jgi:hypothetical protein